VIRQLASPEQKREEEVYFGLQRRVQLALPNSPRI
jgi:hypothetical protein